MRKLGLNTQLVVVNVVLLSLIAVAFALMLGSIGDLRSSSRVSTDEKQMILASEIERRVIDLETSQRGYAITGKPEFLVPRRRAIRALPRLERRLLALEADSESSNHMAELRSLFARIRFYLHDYSTQVMAAARRDPAQARAIIAKGEGLNA